MRLFHPKPDHMEPTFERLFNLDDAPLRRVAEQGEPGLVDGRAIADAMETQLETAVSRLRDASIEPRLSFVQVGRDPASDVYVEKKRETCQSIGIESDHVRLAADVDDAELHEAIDTLSNDDAVHGVLLQLPLPSSLHEEAALVRIPPFKDVDGFHPHNLGALMAGQSRLEPCTPRGIMTLLRSIDFDCTGRRAVVVGRSRIVGRPMAQMLIRADATVAVCHRHTSDLEAEIRRADLVVVATGVANLVPGSWIKPDAVVIDVGITRRDDGRLTGDVEFEAARERASHITPVPGGVGPMTVATLMENTVRATCWQHGLAFEDGELVDASLDRTTTFDLPSNRTLDREDTFP